MINKVKWAFSVGHVFNDLCASLWFLFTLPYFTKVVKIGNAYAGDIILIGQVADAIATPLVGIESDRVGIICHKKIGQRKSWHLLGTILCAISFPFIFNSFNMKITTSWYMIVYYTPFVIIFQIAWAIVQITHLSLIPVLMKLGQDNSSLNSLRYMFTVAANIIVLLSVTFLFNFDIQSKKNGTSSEIVPSTISLNPSDQITFTYLTIGVVGLGLIFSLIFHLGVPETRNEDLSDDNSVRTDCIDDSSTHLLSSKASDMKFSDWFKEPQFYLINLLYLATRLIVNVSQVYLIMYMIDSLKISKMTSSIAVLVTFISGTVASITLKKLQKKIGKKICYLMGLIFVMGYCIMVSFSTYGDPLWQLFLSMVLLGIGCSMIMIGSLSLTAELISTSCSSSAFVYGCMSFSDKMFCGIAIWLLQHFGPATEDCVKCNRYYRYLELYFVGSCAVCGFIILLVLFPLKIGSRRRDRITYNTINGSPDDLSHDS